MSEYIKREDILDFLSGIYDCNDMVFEDDVCGSGADCSTCRWRDTRDFIRKKISRFPAADVVERKRGTWVPFASHAALGTFVKCSECGQTGDASWRGCPRCLAIMDKSEN